MFTNAKIRTQRTQIAITVGPAFLFAFALPLFNRFLLFHAYLNSFSTVSDDSFGPF